MLVSNLQCDGEILIERSETSVSIKKKEEFLWLAEEMSWGMACGAVPQKSTVHGRHASLGKFLHFRVTTVPRKKDVKYTPPDRRLTERHAHLLEFGVSVRRDNAMFILSSHMGMRWWLMPLGAGIRGKTKPFAVDFS